MSHAISDLQTPRYDLADINVLLGCKGYPDDIPLAQYLAWGEQAGILSALSNGGLALEDICMQTELTPEGADALLGMLASLEILRRSGAGLYELSEIAREYLLPDSPFYAGLALYSAATVPMPPKFTRGKPRLQQPRGEDKFLMLGSMEALENQHSRNFAPAVAAVRTGRFAGRRHIVDIGGGSGVFAVPLAADYPETRLTLTELPEVVDGARRMLARYSLDGRVELLGMNAFDLPWPIPPCDGLLFGNFFHGFHDTFCTMFARHSFEKLLPGGVIWLHEMLWNENRDGPLKTALWNASMRSGSIGDGKQRTAAEYIALLRSAGFVRPEVVATSGGFSLIILHRPED